MQFANFKCQAAAGPNRYHEDRLFSVFIEYFTKFGDRDTKSPMQLVANFIVPLVYLYPEKMNSQEYIQIILNLWSRIQSNQITGVREHFKNV